MAFDLQAATRAAEKEADRAPFEFTWGEHTFAAMPMSQWPMGVSLGLARLAKENRDPDIDEMSRLLERVFGADWPRMLEVVPQAAFLVLLTEMTKDQMGADLPDLSKPPQLVSTPT